MATYEITAPDGQMYDVTAPDNATEAEVLAYAQSNFQPKQPIPKQGQRNNKTITEYMTDFLPAIGGIAGGIVGNIPGAVLGGAGGEAWKQNINRLRGNEAPDSSLEAAGDIAKEGAVQGVLQGVGQYVLAPTFKWAGKGLMRSALKPSVSMGDDASVAVETLLKEGVNVTPGGVNKLTGLVDDVNTQISNVIKNNKGLVSSDKVIEAINPVIEKFSNQVDNAADLATIQKTVNNFLDQRGYLIPIETAQKIKTGTYKILEKKYGELGSAAIEAEKGLARGLKNEIANLAPEISQLNARDSALIPALGALQHRVGVAGNQNLGSLSWLASNPAAAAGLLMDRSSLLKSLLARGSYSMGPPIGILAPRIGEGLLSQENR